MKDIKSNKKHTKIEFTFDLLDIAGDLYPRKNKNKSVLKAREYI